MPRITILKPSRGKGFVTKTFSKGAHTNTLYSCKFWTSRTAEINSASEFLELTKTVAKEGSVFSIGHLSFPVVDKELAGTASNDPVSVAWFDVDNIPVHPDEIRNKIPELINATLLVHYSASQGIINTSEGGRPVKEHFNYHIGILLSHPIPLGRWKQLLQYWSIKYFSDYTPLNRTMTSILYPLDTAMAKPSQKLTMRKPIVSDPFKDLLAEDKRIYLIQGETDLFPITNLPDVTPEGIEKLIKAHYKVLRTAQGLSVPVHKTVKLGNGHRQVANNVQPATLHYQNDGGGYSHYNFEDGDSCSYYHKVISPEIMYCFKDDVLPFSHKEVDPKSYEKACERRRKHIATSKDVQRMPFYNEVNDMYYTLFVDNENKNHHVRPIRKQNIADWCESNNINYPEPFEILDVTFNPSVPIAFEPNERWVNTFREPEATKSLNQTKKTPNYNRNNFLDALRSNPKSKALFDVLWSSVGCHKHAGEYLVNWLHQLIVTRERPGTAIILHGTPGTGKDVLVEHLIRPLVGGEYVRQLTMQKLRGNFNEILEQARFVYMPEMYMSQSKDYERLNEFKRLITTTDMEIINAKGIREYQAYLHFGMMFFSNQHGFLNIEPNDRRFYVAPRQEKKLMEIDGKSINDNDWIRTFPEPLQHGMHIFANMLHDYEFSTELHRDLETEAKEQLQIESKTSTDAFFEAIDQGDLDYFLEAVTEPVITKQADGVLELSKNHLLRNFIHAQIMPYINEDHMVMSLKDIHMLYVFITQDQSMKAKKFFSMASKHAIKIDRSGLRSDVDNRIHNNCVIVDWKSRNQELYDSVKNYDPEMNLQPGVTH